jgi:hypothetical protein
MQIFDDIFLAALVFSLKHNNSVLQRWPQITHSRNIFRNKHWKPKKEKSCHGLVTFLRSSNGQATGGQRAQGFG